MRLYSNINQNIAIGTAGNTLFPLAPEADLLPVGNTSGNIDIEGPAAVSHGQAPLAAGAHAEEAGVPALDAALAVEEDEVLLTATFDPKVRVYWYVQGLIAHFFLIMGFVGIFTFPLWMLLGPFVVQRRYANLSCVLTDDALHLHPRTVHADADDTLVEQVARAIAMR